jgi:hypothetical protein
MKQLIDRFKVDVIDRHRKDGRHPPGLKLRDGVTAEFVFKVKTMSFTQAPEL